MPIRSTSRFADDQAGAVLHAEPVHLAREVLAELVEQVLPQGLLLQGLEDGRFDLVAANGQMVVTASLIAGSEHPRRCLPVMMNPELRIGERTVV
jgi:hypothetical protein